MPTCCVCNRAQARRPHGQYPECGACQKSISERRRHTAAELERYEAEARVSLMRAVLVLRRIHAARYGHASLTRLPPEPKRIHARPAAAP